MRMLHTAPCSSVAVLHDFDGEVRRKIVAAKYHNERKWLREFARDIAAYLTHIGTPEHCVVTWAPTSDARRRSRGVDQSEVLARHVGAYTHLPVKQCLRKITDVPQTGAPRAVRLTQVAFVARVPSHVSSVVVIDDVVTTGATMMAAVRALQREGVEKVMCIAVAGTR